MGSSLVFSIEQNLCLAVSKAEWKLPKHVLISVSVKHLIRSAQAGHDDRGYDFGLELKTVLAKTQVDVSTYLMPQIVTGEGNTGFHCEWDNLNRTTTSVHGNTIVNSSGGIMLTNKLSIVHVIDKNKLRWFGLVMRRQEESMFKVVMQLKTKGKRPREKKNYVARQHRSPLKRIDHISERSPPNEMFRE